MRTIEITVYTEDMSYLVNNDATGYDYYNAPNDLAGDRMQERVDEFVQALGEQYGAGHIAIGDDAEAYFGRPNYCKLWGNVVDCLYVTFPIGH